MTFSIAARCDASGQFGAAIASATPCVGTFCLWMQSSVGVCCTQSWTNPYLAINALSQLEAGCSSEQSVDAAVSNDSNANQRQLGVVGKNGNGCAWTGIECTDEYGHVTGPGYSIQGNMLGSADVLTAMADKFLLDLTQPLEERLLAALEAGQRASGDRRGQQSAALATIGDKPWRRLDLRVDEHTKPIEELQRVLPIANRQFLPFADALPDSTGKNAENIEAVRALMLTEPSARL
ncbi:MAG: DUF1028 domain-containing protein [Pseudomonadota bacterium]